MTKTTKNEKEFLHFSEQNFAYCTSGQETEFAFAELGKASFARQTNILQKSGRNLAADYAGSVRGSSAKQSKSISFSAVDAGEDKTGLDPALIFPDSNEVSLFLRRLFDLAFSATVLILLSPLYLLIALLIKIQSPDAPVIFTQKRLGLNGEFFNLYKFRTMVPNAEKILADWLETRPEIKEEYFTYRKLKNDPRIIPWVGTFLRKSSLDELPQFFNVLLGDMSVVGPRPYIKEEFYQHSQEVVDAITSVKPGITGYWQTRERHANTFDHRVNTDLEYLQVRTFWLDLEIIVNTVTAMVFKTGA